MTFFVTQLQELLSTQSLQNISHVDNWNIVFLVQMKEIGKVYKEVNMFKYIKKSTTSLNL